MNRFYKILGIVIIITVIGFSITACGGSESPKGLAKQGHELYREGKKIKPSDKEAMKKFQAKSKAWGEKVDKLSKEDAKIFAKEYEQLIKKYGL